VVPQHAPVRTPHLPNTLFGTGVAGISQVGITFLIGTVFYLLRRVSGTLILSMLVHGLWDFSTFAAVTVPASIIAIGVGIAAVIVTIVILRKEARTDAA
jgi:membrane protease YdiL (CAAX protease family)